MTKQNDQNSGAQGESSSGDRQDKRLAANAGPVSGGNPPQALDRWFDDQLNQLFNDVSSEPLPADLAKLIGQLKSQGQK